MSAYRKNLYIPYTAEIHGFLGNLKNPKYDDYSVRELTEHMKSLLKPEGFDRTVWYLALVWRENPQVIVDAELLLKELRTYPEGTFEFRLFVTTSMSIDPFSI